MSALRQFVASLEQTERFSKTQLLAFQRKSLARLVTHARATVPFYRDRLSPLFRRDGSIDWEGWSDVPLLTKDDLRNHFPALQSADLHPRHGDITSDFSSGSTGEPVETRHTALEATAMRAITARFHRWHGVERAQKMAAIRSTFAGEAAYPDGAHRDRWTTDDDGGGDAGPYALLNVNTPVHLQAEWLARQAPGILHTYPSNAAALAHLAADDEWIRPSTILTFAELVTDETRSICREAFGLELADCYSAHECGYIALQCPDNPHYHVQSEVTKVEVIDADGTLCSPGKMGRVVCTTLYNYAMPLIRYAMQDHAVPGKACPCGRPHPVLSRIHGRTRNLFRFPDGSIVQPDFKPRTIAAFLAPRQWQVAQTGPLEIEIRLVADLSRQDMDTDGMTAYIHRLLRPDLRVTYKRMDAISVSPSGKHEDYVCELPGEIEPA